MVAGSPFGQGRVIERSDGARYVARLDDLARDRVARRLGDLMKARRIGAHTLSARSHVPVNTIYSALSAKTTPRLGCLIALADGLEVTVDQLLAPTGVDDLVHRAEKPDSVAAAG